MGMFNLLKGKKARRREKLEKVRALAKSQRRINLSDSELELLGDDILDIIIAANYINDIYFEDMGVAVSEAPVVATDPDPIVDAVVNEERVREEALAEAAAARDEYSSYSSRSIPEPEPETVKSEPTTRQTWGSSSSSSEDNSSRYDSNDSGGGGGGGGSDD